MLPIIAHDRDDSLELKPLVQAIFEQLFSAGIRTFYIVVGRGKRAIEDHFSPDPSFLEFLEKNSKLPRGMSDFYEKIKSSKLVFLNQPEPLGFGDAVLLGQSLIDEPFIVQAADTLILSDRDAHIERLAGLHRKYHASATVLLRDVPDPRNYGVVEGDYLEPGVLGITSAVEKPETPRSNHAIMPVYVFSDEIFEALASTGPGRGGEIQLTDAIQRLAIAGKKVIGVLLHGDELMLDLGSPETMIEALKLSLRYADEKGHAASVAENLPRMPKPPRRRAAEMPSLRGPDASLPREIRGGVRPIVARALAYADVPGTDRAWRVCGPDRGHPDVSVRCVEGRRDRRRDRRRGLLGRLRHRRLDRLRRVEAERPEWLHRGHDRRSGDHGLGGDAAGPVCRPAPPRRSHLEPRVDPIVGQT